MPLQAPKHSSWITLSRLLFSVGILAQITIVGLLLRSYVGDASFRGPAPVAQAASIKPLPLPSNGFTLRHLIHHGAGQPGPRIRRLDITADRVATADADSQIGPFTIKTSLVKIERSAVQPYDSQTPMSPMWVAEDVEGPDVEDKETVINFAYMSENAYKTGPDDPGWLDVDGRYNSSIPFGWDDSGIRGQLFTDETNSIVILSLKGTTVAMFEGNGTSVRDKENDNLFGSCCCGQGGAYLWRRVCDCLIDTYTCDETCIKKELRQPNKYHKATVELYNEVVQIYPRAKIIATGHSLGGVLASLIGLQHGIPAITFEAYPQALAASRLGLPTAGDVAPLRKHTGGFHFGHTADPVYMGTCNGGNSFCSIGGYAFETICHTGKKCAYDVVKDWGWRQSTQTHVLRYAIDKVYSVYEKAAKCVDEDVDCVDCFSWKFQNGSNTKPITTSTATSTTISRTRTETCKTPGWWGCRDPTSTTVAFSTSVNISTSTSTSTSTTTCHTPGWFGCKDKTTTLTSTTSTTPTTSPSTTTTTTTCTSKGWFGRCLDEKPTTSTPAAEAHVYWRTTPTATRTAT